MTPRYRAWIKTEKRMFFSDSANSSRKDYYITKETESEQG